MRIVLLTTLLALTGCTSDNFVRVPPLPAWVEPSDTRTFATYEVRTRVLALRPGIPVHASDNTYSLVSSRWLDSYIAWTWNAGRYAGITYVPDAFDCDDYAIGFHFFATRAAARAGKKVAPLVARVVVNPPTGLHELNAVATDAGIFIVEPQPGGIRKIPLADYPHPILSVVFGDFNPYHR